MLVLVDIIDFNIFLGLDLIIAPEEFKVPCMRRIDAIFPLAIYSRRMYPI